MLMSFLIPNSSFLITNSQLPTTRISAEAHRNLRILPLIRQH